MHHLKAQAWRPAGFATFPELGGFQPYPAVPAASMPPQAAGPEPPVMKGAVQAHKS